MTEHGAKWLCTNRAGRKHWPDRSTRFWLERRQRHCISRNGPFSLSATGCRRRDHKWIGLGQIGSNCSSSDMGCSVGFFVNLLLHWVSFGGARVDKTGFILLYQSAHCVATDYRFCIIYERVFHLAGPTNAVDTSKETLNPEIYTDKNSGNCEYKCNYNSDSNNQRFVIWKSNFNSWTYPLNYEPTQLNGRILSSQNRKW